MSDLALRIPRLATPRLVLRAFQRDDFEAYAAHLADPEARPAQLPVIDRRGAWRVFAAGFGFWALDGAGWWAIELAASGVVVGTVGAFFRETRVPGAPRSELELGWSLYREHWARGYASEAAAAALAYALPAHGAPRAIAHIDASNLASVRVAERLGMVFDQEVEFYTERIRRYVTLAAAAEG